MEQKCKCGRPMALRKGRYGMFYGCENFPDCRNTRTLIQAALDNPYRKELTTGLFKALEEFEDLQLMHVRGLFLLNYWDEVFFDNGGNVQDGFFEMQGQDKKTANFTKNRYVIRIVRSKYRRPNFETNVWKTQSETFFEEGKYYYISACNVKDLEKLDLAEKQSGDCNNVLFFYKEFDPFANRYSLTQMLKGWIKGKQFYYKTYEKGEEVIKSKRLSAKSIVKIVWLKEEINKEEVNLNTKEEEVLNERS